MAIVESIEPENGRYRADILFLHGLWTTAEIWKPAALGLAHRGWGCHLIDLRAGGPADTLETWCQRAQGVVEEFAERPILVGHDAGALVALALSEHALARAVVADAPLLSGAPRFHPRLALAIARWRKQSLPPPPEQAPMLQVGSAAGQTRLLHALCDDTARLVDSLRGRAIQPGRPVVPTLLMASPQDPVVPESLVAITAKGIEASYLPREGGHYGMLEEPYDIWMSQVQRWLVLHAGPDLLRLSGAEDLDPDALI